MLNSVISWMGVGQNCTHFCLSLSKGMKKNVLEYFLVNVIIYTNFKMDKIENIV